MVPKRTAGECPQPRAPPPPVRELDVFSARVAKTPERPRRERYTVAASALQRMIGADIRCRALATNMLLARIQSQAEGAATDRDRGLVRPAARHLAHLRHPGRHEADSRAAELQRNPKL